MTCEQYLTLHTELLDERLDFGTAARCRAHADGCGSCRRYDRVVRRGLELARDLPRITASADFHQRLQHRLFHLQDDLAGSQRIATSGAAVALAIAGAIALAAWTPMLARNSSDAAVAALTEADEDARAESALADDAGALPQWWYGGSAGGVFTYTTMSSPPTSALPGMPAAFPGPYSPLVVSPPVLGRGVVSVLAGYNE